MKFSQLLNRKDSIKEKAQTAFVRASKLFDERWYASRYQDVFKKLKDPARHYYLVGWKENRNPSENFDTASYLRQYPECGICPIVFEHNRNDYADLAVCTIVKDEASYIKEWLDYHLMVGVKRFYIYDNESFDNLKQVLLPYIRQGVVIYQYYPGEAMQLNCYRDCLKQYGDKNEWIAFIDADEFIIPMENATIPEFLADYKEYPAVGVNWVSYDSNGHKEKPKGGVMENYTRVHYDENMVPFHLIKSIVRPQEVSKVVNPHFFLYKGDKLAVNENKEEIGGDLSERAYISPFSTNKIRINHYYCKSRAEAEAKVLRGSSDRDIRRRKNISAKELNFPDYKYDYTAYKFVLQLNPEKAKIEEIKMAWLRLKNAFIEFKHTFNPSPLYDYIDEKWYFEQYPDAKKSGMSAAKHYVNIGWRKGYNPSKKFNTEFYLNKYKDVAKAHICPLLHYLNSGKNEGRLAYETNTVISATEPVSQPLLKHLSEWVKNLSKEKEREYNELWQNKAYFDENWYLKQYPDVKESGMSAKKHYDTIGWLQGYNPSAKFKTNEYLKQYPECGICPIDFEYNRNRYVDLAVCAIMKNEAPYVKEWLDYHQMVGVKRFYIYDNESGDDLCQVLLPYIRQGIVVYKNYPGEAKQMPAYNEFIKEYGDKNEWVAFIDADEFIIPMEKESIPEFLADYREYPGIGINWVAYDSNGHKAKPEGGVLENYTRVHYDENLVPFHQIKSIVQPSQVDKIINPHYALFKDNKLAVNENKQEIGGSLEERAYISPFSANKIRINHYFTKSEEEYKAKIERGRAPTKRSIKRVYNQNQVFFDDYKYDYSAYRFVAKLKPEIAQDEELKYLWQKMKNTWIAFKHKVKHNPLYDYIDEKWYFEQYPDAKESGMSAAEHYMNIGWRKGYNPSKKFDTNFYLKKYKDVARMHVCPLLHYLNSGKKEGRLAFEGDTVISATEQTSHKIEGHTGFSPVSQPTKNSTVIPAAEPVSSPLLKSLCQWCKTLFKGKEEKYNELWNNNEYFDEDWYVANYAEAGNYKKGPKAHYRTEGWKKGYNPSPKFNTEEYLKQYPECKICPIDFEYNRNGYVDLSIVAIMRNEAPYVKEWIDYHRLVGVKRFYIYDNESTDNLKEVLTPYIEQGVVIYMYYPGLKSDGVQTKAYNECVANYKDKTEWLAIIDADEFILPIKKSNIPEFLGDYRDYPGVVLYWMTYDSNGHIEKPVGGVMENYTRIYYNHNNHADTRTKMIVKPTQILRAGIHLSHYINEDKGNVAVDADYRKILPFKQAMDTPCYDKIRINHYRSKSYSEFKSKIKKPRAGNILTDSKYLYDFDNYNYDYAIYKYVKKLPNKNRIREFFRYWKLFVYRIIIYFQHRDGRDIRSYIDEKWYAKQYPDYKQEAPNAYEHYMNIGWKKGYNPSKKFDTNFYLSEYSDIGTSNVNPLVHFVDHGLKEGRKPYCLADESSINKEIKQSGMFDYRWYLKHYPEVEQSGVDAITHYLNVGWKKGYNPSKKFDTNFYLEKYPDIARAGINPLRHYINAGKSEGREISEVFDYEETLLQKLWKKFFVKKLNNPKISIIVASYNYEQYIHETLDSLINQTYKNFEVIVVDDGSKDNSISIIKEYINKYSNIFLYTHENGQNRGLVETVKLGLSKANGDYIAFCESDDCWLTNHLENKVKLINKYFNPEIIANDVELFDQPTEEYISYLDNGIRKFQEEVIRINVMQQTYNPLATFSSIMFRKDVLENCNFDSVIPAWTDWWLHRQILIKYPLYYVNQRLTMWRIHDSYNTTERNNKYAEKYNEFMVYSNSLLAKESAYVNEYLKNNTDYKQVAESGLFDEKFYKQRYPEMASLNVPAIYHFNMIGWKKGYSPSNQFDAKAYLNIHKDVKEANMNPLLHYIRMGKSEGRNIVACDYTSSIYKSDKEQPKHYKGNVLLVSHMLNHTGAPILLKQVAELLISKRYKVTIMSPTDGDLRDEILALGCDVIIDTLAYAGEEYCNKYKNYNFDFCICNTYLNAYVYSYLSKFIPSIMWIHDNLNEQTANSIMPVLSTSKDIYAASKLTKSYMVPYNKDIKILTYPANDVVGQISKRNNDKKRKTRIAVCAALQPRKGQDIFIEAIKMLPDNIRENAEFLLLGEEGQIGYKEILENMCVNTTEIKFVEAIKTPKEYHNFIDGLDVLCCPSREDPCPLVVLDAFMHGVPVIVSDHVGQKDIIRNKKDGYIFKNEDINELSQILNHLIVSKEYLLMRNKSRAIFERNFSDKTFLNDLFKIMEEKCAI